MTSQTIWYDMGTGRVKAVEQGESLATMPGLTKALSDTDTVGKITLDHVVSVTDGKVTGATFSPPEVPPEIRRANLHQYLAQLGRRRRLALVGRSPNDPDVDSAEAMLQVEQAVLQHKRQTGRSNANDNARLGEMEALGEAMLGVWQAQQAIKSKIKNDTYTTTDDIDNAREWP